MKFSENWLRTLANPPIGTRELADVLSLSGLDVEQVDPAAAPFSGGVVGEIVKVDRHPQADRLTVCQVNAGGNPVTIVCGAPNAAPGLRVPAALPGAKL